MPTTDLVSSQVVGWIISLKINPGREADFKAHSAKLVESTRQELGALNYEWSLNDEGLGLIYERYADSDAARTHSQRNAELVKQLWTMATTQSLTLYGSPDEEVQTRMGARGAVYLKPLGGFGRS
jgi:quinol monooxygenase YgiN